MDTLGKFWLLFMSSSGHTGTAPDDCNEERERESDLDWLNEKILGRLGATFAPQSQGCTLDSNSLYWDEEERKMNDKFAAKWTKQKADN